MSIETVQAQSIVTKYVQVVQLAVVAMEQQKRELWAKVNINVNMSDSCITKGSCTSRRSSEHPLMILC